jgi:FtsZ-binding cell division protein ZapB
MLEQLDTLETKLAQMLERYQALRDDNQRLRQQVLALESTNKALSERLDGARERMEALYHKIPD